MKFIITRSGALINTAHIVSVSPTNNCLAATAHMVNGDQVDVHTYEYDELEEDTTIIPAHPGYRVIYPQDDGTALFDDIIAWKISANGLRVQPITPQGARPNAAILSLNGSVDDFDGGWETLADYLAEKKK